MIKLFQCGIYLNFCLNLSLSQLKKDEEFVELSSRRNIFDNDDFDVFRKDKIDLSKVSLGKRFLFLILMLLLSL